LESTFFFFQAEDGIRDFHVTGVQTCALPISARHVQLGTQGGGQGAAGPRGPLVDRAAPGVDQGGDVVEVAGGHQAPTSSSPWSAILVSALARASIPFGVTRTCGVPAIDRKSVV